MKKSLSLVHVLAVIIMLTVSVWNFAVYFNAIRGKTNEQIEFQKNKIEMTLSYLPKFFEKGFEDLAIDYIEAGKVSNYFDFFILKKNGQPLINSSNLKNIETRYLLEGGLHQEIMSNELSIYVSKKTMGPYEVTLGYFPANNDIFTKKNILTVLQANIMDSIVFFAAIVLLGMKGFFKQTNLILSGRREELENLNPTTVEGKLLKNLFLHASNLTKKSIELTIPDGIEVELSKGTVVGTTFRSGIIRIDLNNYTALCEKYGTGTMDSLLSPIFAELRELAQRYGFYEVADGGDERVFYSRDDGDISNRALAAVRNMFDCGKRYSPEYFEKFGFYLNFKASFALGNLGLKKEDGKHKLKGDAYTYSQRCIETFKSRNAKNYIFVLPKKDFNSEWMTKNTINEIHNLKGLGTHELIFISEFQEKPIESSQLKYYLSNEEIRAHLQSLFDLWNDDKFWSLFDILRTFKSNISNPFQLKDLIGFLKSEQLRVLDETVIASLIILIPKLVHNSDLDEASICTIKNFLKTDSSRVKANTLEALGDLGVFIEESRDFLKATDNRSRANALIILGRNNIGNEILKNLKEMLTSKEEPQVLSGLYAVERLFQYHENQDLTFFKTAQFFRDLFGEMGSLKKHEAQIISQRAIVIIDLYGHHFI